MPTIDELKNAYSKLSNSKLAGLLNDIQTLSSEAQQVLKDEVEKRNLESNEIKITNSKEVNFANSSARISKRFINYFLDFFAIIIVNLIVFIFSSALSNIISTVLGFVCIFGFPIFNFIYLEGKYGKTIGKFITKTTVYKSDNSKITYSDAAMRTLLRIIPFDGFFLLTDEGLTLHDRFTNTYVKED